MRRTGTLLVLAAAAALGVTACSSSGSTGAAGSAGSAGSAGEPTAATATSAASSGAPAPAAPVALVWKTCGGQTNKADQCSSMKVPLDPAAPKGTQVTLSLIRRPASTSDKSLRIGSMLINPGGPGGSTIDEFDGLTDELSVTLRQRFDVVGFDPRGVGHSTPAIACANGAQADRLNADSPDPLTAAGQAKVIADAQETVQACVTNSGLPLLTHVGTADAARDMDAIRAAVGDAKLTYLGYSYGTFLGAEYAKEFPTHVRALVLDGAEDPGLSDTTGTEVQAVGFETSLKAFLADCSSAGTSCAWRPGGDLLTAYRALMSRIAANPLPTKDSARPLTLTLAQNGVAAALYDKANFPVLEQALSNASAGDGSTLLALSDYLTERDDSGKYSNLDAALVSVDCRDTYQPTGIAPVLASYKRLQASAPDFAAFALSEYDCGIWPVRPTAQTPFSVTGAPPVLIVGATGDPATPLSEARGLASEVSGSRLLVRNGEGHTSYDASTCVRAAADNYLLDPSVLPPVGKVCPSP